MWNVNKHILRIQCIIHLRSILQHDAMQPYSTTKVTLQEGLRSPKKWQHVTAAREIHTPYRTLLVVQAKNSPSNHSFLHLSLRSRLFLRKTRLFIRTCSKQNRNGMKWNPNRMKHATMCNLFCYPEKVFCKNRDWEKAYRRSVMPWI